MDHARSPLPNLTAPANRLCCDNKKLKPVTAAVLSKFRRMSHQAQLRQTETQIKTQAILPFFFLPFQEGLYDKY